MNLLEGKDRLKSREEKIQFLKDIQAGKYTLEQRTNSGKFRYVEIQGNSALDSTFFIDDVIVSESEYREATKHFGPRDRIIFS